MEISDSAIVEKGTSVLLKELGYSGFIKYIRLLTKGNNDYLILQDDIFKDMTVDEIFQSAKDNWKNI